MKKNKLLTSLFLLCILFVSFMPIQSAAAEKTGEKNLYYILTPYSGLGAASIALGKPSKDVNDAFIYDTNRFTKECINNFKSIFDNIYILGRDNETVGRKNTIIVILQILTFLLAKNIFISRTGVPNIFQHSVKDIFVMLI